jgi:ureidoacrylate peracid hydrolase
MTSEMLLSERTALLTIDLQNLFVAGYPHSAPDGLPLLQRMNQLAAVCRQVGITVIHVSHVLRPDGSNTGILGDLHPEVRAGLISRGSHAAALHHDLVNGPEDLLLEKPRYGAFHGTDLELILRARGIDTVIIGGIATNICCDTTAREAMMRDFRVFFLSDGTATTGTERATAAELQQATLETLNGAFGHVLTVEEMVQAILEAPSTAAPSSSIRLAGA